MTEPRATSSTSVLPMIIRRSLRHHALSSIVTVIGVALSCGLVMGVFSIQQQSEEAFTSGGMGFDAVLGARGSQLQLVLNSLFHLETSPGNIPWQLYEDMLVHPAVKEAVPIAVGDNYHGFRVVGTEDHFFDTRCEVAEGGRLFDASRREAVVGSFAAAKTGLRYGSTFSPVHGFMHDGHVHAEEYVVVGILEPTNTPVDRVIWIPIEGIFRMSGHVLRGAGETYEPEPEVPIPSYYKEISAVLLMLRSAGDGMHLDRQFNHESNEATFAWPVASVMTRLFDKIGWVSRILRLIAVLVVVISASAVLAALYNTINERRREFAILRALGAKARTVFSVVMLESATLSAIGGVLGFGVYAAVVWAASTLIRRETGVVIDMVHFHPALIWTPLGVTLLGALTGMIPAVKAYATDVAEYLVPR